MHVIALQHLAHSKHLSFLSFFFSDKLSFSQFPLVIHLFVGLNEVESIVD